MAQDPERIPLSENLGYVLKQAQSALHSAMDAALRPLGLTVSQYSCLEQLNRVPDQTNAQLARGTFVTAQSMNDVLRGLQRRGLVERPDTAPAGRARPTRLTVAGQAALDDARQALTPVDQIMDAIAGAPENAHLVAGLQSIVAGLGPGAPDDSSDA
ncbi:MarR family transcriptional regulator [Gryllotalpicola daejeonensis]|uniref:MarR family transcriptional regulator n=1 Tax=Gryllotalpicola daejeonensis TaxID=993087 RepID=A0ABP7ZCX3_9MICO